MNKLLKRHILLISILLLYGIDNHATAQRLLPASEGEVVSFSSFIEMPRGYVSGICAMMLENRSIKATMYNEFGITAMEFVYSMEKKKVKLEYVIKLLDKWYIKRTLRKDLACLINCLDLGNTEYVNKKRKITYRFIPMEDNELTSDIGYDTE